MRKLNICVDFDGQIVSNRYPYIGVPLNGAKETMSKWKADGHTIIVSSCRAGLPCKEMEMFLYDWPVDYINENNPELIRLYGTDTRKISCDICFDDKNALGFLGWDVADELVQELANKKPLIICLVGESGTGKTTLANWIERQFGIPMINSYTDRPERYSGEDGHIFVTPYDFDLFDVNDMIAYTEFGQYRYCCLAKDVKDVNTYVIDEHGFEMLVDKYKDIFDIKSIRLTCPASVRHDRAGVDRCNRDAGKFNLPLSLFDSFINTDKDILSTRDEATQIINNLL